MSEDIVRQEEFGKDLGLIHEVVVTGRKVGATKEFWSKLAHNEDLFRSVVSQILPQELAEQNILAGWSEFYSQTFGIETDFSNLPIPEKRRGFDRLIVVAQGMTPQGLYDKCKELFPCWKWTNQNLDEIVISDRTAKDGLYAIWVRDKVEADKELTNLSADQLRQRGIPGITLEERLLLELKYFKETGKHLDIMNITLCSGSRRSDGEVPHVHWYDGVLRVYWYHPDNALVYLRSRQAVS